RPLHGRSEVALCEPVREDEPARSELGEVDLPRELLVEVRPVLDLDSSKLALEDGRERQGVTTFGQRDDDDVRADGPGEPGQVLHGPEDLDPVDLPTDSLRLPVDAPEQL